MAGLMLHNHKLGVLGQIHLRLFTINCRIRYKYHRFSSGKYISRIVFPLKKIAQFTTVIDWVVFKSGVWGISDAIQGHLVNFSNESIMTVHAHTSIYFGKQ
jgi:hypothetical protein